MEEGEEIHFSFLEHLKFLLFINLIVCMLGCERTGLRCRVRPMEDQWWNQPGVDRPTV